MSGASIALIDNAGPNSVKAIFKALCANAATASVHVAFTTSAGLAALLPALQRVATKGRVRILTGLYQGFTEPKALWVLLSMQKQSGGRLEVKISQETNFHRKAYVTTTKTTMHMIVGSSNLTDNGLISTGELSLQIGVLLRSAKAKQIDQVFAKAWSNAAALAAPMIRRYEKARVVPKVKSPTQKKLASILGKVSHEKADAIHEPAVPRFWVDGIRGYVTSTTEATIKAETSWDRNGWSWMTIGSSVLLPGDCVVMIDRTSKPIWISVVRVKDTAGPISTPDGRYFAAYTQIANTHRRKLTPGFRSALKQAGVSRTNGDRRRLKEKRWPMVLALFQ